MGPPSFALYAPHRRSQVLSAFGASGATRTLCDGQWVILPDAVLCFAEFGAPPSQPHLASGSQFVWVATRPYVVAPDGCPFLPEEVRQGHVSQRPIHLFGRAAGAEAWLYLGQLAPSHTYGYAEEQPLGSATFSLSPVLPREVWHALGGPAPVRTALRDVFSRLQGPTSVHTRLGVLKDFVERWHGPLRPEDGIPEEVLRGVRLPPPLRAWLRLGGRRAGVLSGQNQLQRVLELVPDEEGYLLFWTESQGCYLWATRLDAEDPQVFGRESAEGPWTPEGMSLSEFLLQMAVFEAIMSAPYGASAPGAPEATVQQALAPLTALPLPPWRWPSFPTQFHAGDDVLAMTSPDENGGGVDLFVAARDPALLAYLAPLVDDTWSRADL